MNFSAILPFASSLLLISLLLSGCGTVQRGASDDLVVESNPPGAIINMSNGIIGKTPARYSLDREEPITVVIGLPGYVSETIKVRSVSTEEGRNAVAGNLWLGGLVGYAVDSATGAEYGLFPNPISVNLAPYTTTSYECRIIRTTEMNNDDRLIARLQPGDMGKIVAWGDNYNFVQHVSQEGLFLEGWVFMGDMEILY